jgi:hypothetical protein
MKQIQIATWVIFGFFIFLFACNDPSTIGSDLIGEDFLDLGYTDTVTLKGYSLKTDSVITFDPIELGVETQPYFVGNLNDPVFGVTNASFYAQFSRNNSSVPNFANSTLDSIVLILPWDGENNYGNLDELYTIEVYQLNEKLNNSTYHFTNKTHNVKPIRAASTSFYPKPTDSVTVRIPNKDSIRTVKLAPQLRIKMNEDFIEDFFRPTSDVFTLDSLFQDFFKGLHIKASSQNSGLLAFKARNSAAGLKVYTRKDTVYSDYTFPIYYFNVVASHFNHNYTGSVAGRYLGNTGTKSDSLLFLQGMSGLNFVVEFPYVQNIPKVIVNKAELEFTILRLPEDRSVFKPSTQLLISEVRGDSVVVVDDLTFAVNKAGEEFYRIFGGNVYNEQKYKLNISSHFQKMMSGSRSNKMRVEVYLKGERPGRVVVAGPNHSTSPAKLKLSLTKF